MCSIASVTQSMQTQVLNICSSWVCCERNLDIAEEPAHEIVEPMEVHKEAVTATEPVMEAAEEKVCNTMPPLYNK